ncbi:MAG: helicase-exonuclease AddAB subunit AddA [Lachnospiraceae bacterium]
MGFDWTIEQKQVIELRDRNILVSAAAGSGKTAVLVQRIIGKILDPVSPVDIDRMLIVTFTNAAAAEMKERIGLALESALEKDPESEHLQRQTALIHHAQITTIHSFCLSIVRNHYHKIDLEPNFRIAEEGELNLLQEEVAEEVLIRNYENQEPDFIRFVESFATGKSDQNLKDHIFKLYRSAMSNPWPKEWIGSLTRPYQMSTISELEAADWMQQLILYLKSILNDLMELAEMENQIAAAPDGPNHLMDNASDDLLLMQSFQNCTTYQDYADAFINSSFTRLKTSRSYDASEEKLERFKRIRAQIKDQIEHLKKQFFFESAEDICAHMQKMLGVTTELCRLTSEFQEAYQKKKLDRNLIDFSDLEHFALQILIEESTKEVTDTAREYKEQFNEVMIDEYQDSNLVQETLLKAVSKDTEYNRFMVGDVKQSIYRFRLARPEIFMEKYRRYHREDAKEQKIELHQNFRSRSEVLDFSNSIFRRIMKEDLGRVEYNDEAALYKGASFPDSDDMTPEVLLGNESDEGLAETEIENRADLEAGMIAARIRTLRENTKISDKNSGMLRGVNYSDIVILLRSYGAHADTFLRIFEEKGIPAFTDSRTGYFKATEIQIMLNMLRVIDNPRQDIALVSVLRSPMFHFSDEELSLFKSDGERVSFYKSVLEASAQQLPEYLQNKRDHFLKCLNQFRSQASEGPLHELIILILNETGYRNFITAMPAGKRRLANMEMLIEKAIQFEQTSFRGLFHFIRYIDRLFDYSVDYGEAEIVSENEDAVRIMSIHKSKGLEFPVVFVSGIGRNFNKQDTRSQLIIHPEYGLGLDHIDPELRIKTPMLHKRVLACLTDLDNLGEELRILYVALTRAKEKLILTGTVRNAKEYYHTVQSEFSPAEHGLDYIARAGARSYLEWILPALSLDRQLEKVQIMDCRDFLISDISQQTRDFEKADRFLQLAASTDPKVLQQFADALHYQYPFQADVYLQQKYSVSELKHRAMQAMYEQEEHIEQTFEKSDASQGQTENTYVPVFMDGSEKVNLAAERGSAMHRVLECIPIREIAESGNKEDTLTELIHSSIRDGKLSASQEELLNRKQLLTFYNSRLARRIAEAEKLGNVYREQPFVMGISSDTFVQSASTSQILVQGMIDIYFIEDGEIVLLDYKTDVIRTGEELVRRYGKQIELYEEALCKGTGLRIKESILYSFQLGEEVFVSQ